MSNPIYGYWYRLSAYPTGPERSLEPAVAALGEPYRAQHLFVALKHIADFALLRRKIIIEVDGASHQLPAQMKKDLEHTIALQALGWTVVRISNEWAERDPYGAVTWVLQEAARLRVVSPDYQGALARHLLDYPDRPAGVAKRPRSTPPSRVKTPAAKAVQSIPVDPPRTRKAPVPRPK